MASNSSDEDPQNFRTTLEIEQTAAGDWRAFEPAGSRDYSGREDSPHETVADYALHFVDAEVQEVAADGE